MNVIDSKSNLTYSPATKPWFAMVGSSTPVLGLYVAVEIVWADSLMYECPAPTFITNSPVAGLYVDVDIERSSIVETPTLSSKVFVVADMIPRLVLYAGSVGLGYACSVA